MKFLVRMFGIDLRALAAFRVAIGVILLIDLCHRARYLVAHYTDYGVLPRNIVTEFFSNQAFWSLHLINGSAVAQVALFLVAGGFAFALMIGYRTQIAIFVSWVLLVSLQNRNPMVLNAGDVLLRCLLFWSMFLPLGAWYSVDRALQDIHSKLPSGQSRTVSIATAAILLQVACVYFVTGFLKNHASWYPDGTASYMALSIDHFTTPFGNWMRDHYEFLRYSTYGVLALERFGSILFVTPWFSSQARLCVALALMAMHAGFATTMHLGMFPYIDMASLLILIDGPYWRKFGSWMSGGKSAQIQIFYDTDCGFCRKMAYLVQEFTGLQRNQVSPASENEGVQLRMTEAYSWVVLNRVDGSMAIRWAAFVAVLRHSPVFGLFARLLPLLQMQRLGDWLYNQVAYRRDVFGRFSAILLPYRPVQLTARSWLGQAVLALAIAAVAQENIADLRKEDNYINWLSQTAMLTRLDQSWDMFAPFPMTDDGWYVMDGHLRDGSRMDVWRETPGIPSFDKPQLVSRYYPTQRWRKYLMNLWLARYQQYRLPFGRWLCRSRNEGVAENKQLVTFKIHYVEEATIPAGGVHPVRVHQIWDHNCFKK